jgi:hypothetical protein
MALSARHTSTFVRPKLTTCHTASTFLCTLLRTLSLTVQSHVHSPLSSALINTAPVHAVSSSAPMTILFSALLSEAHNISSLYISIRCVRLTAQ